MGAFVRLGLSVGEAEERHERDEQHGSEWAHSPQSTRRRGSQQQQPQRGDSRNAFRVSILWGLGCLFLPFVSLFFLITNWDKAGRPFLIGLLGAVVLVGGVILTPRPARGALHSYQQEVAADAE